MEQVHPIGREPELQAIERFLDDVSSGAHARSLVLEGEAGIGKTTLWRAGVEDARARGLRVLACAPASDKTLAFLDQLALGPALRSQLQGAFDAFAGKHPKSACLALDLYIAAVRLAPARALAQAEKTELVADARRIKAVIGC